MTTDAPPPGQRGVVHWAARYDLLITLITLGKEGALRERMLELARLKKGDAVLDVGCGTGTLAIAAKRHVGASGSVAGIDPSPEMIARAEKKARRANVDAAFDVAFAQKLPFADASFDVVMCTVMLHHLRRAMRTECLREMKRVLKPSGRILVVDFGVRSQSGNQRGLLAHFHKHGRVTLDDLVSLVTGAGLRVIDSGDVGVGTLLYLLSEHSL